MLSAKKIKTMVSASLTALFVLQQTMGLSVMASEITGVLPNGNVYNIDPTALIEGTDIGYRKYADFQLDEGDIANLIFQYGANDVNTFINLVDNQIQVNGIINSMRDGNFYNGKAVFVSPNGMVVGASGVLNVGSLGVYTPNKNVYDDYKKNPRADLSVLKNSNSNASVTVNGKVIATNDIDIHSGRIEVPGKMLAGTGNNAVITGRQRAEELFNSIVNTSNMRTAKDLISAHGNISLTSSVNTVISGDMRNIGRGNTTITNTGKGGIRITGNSSNYYGNTMLDNRNGEVQVSGKLSNYNGTMIIDNKGNGGVNIVKSGLVETTNDNNKQSLIIENSGISGINIDGQISNNGDATITNAQSGLHGINVSGTIINNNGQLEFYNFGQNGLNVSESAKIKNSNGNSEYFNRGANGLNISGEVSNSGSGSIYLTNIGDKGINIASDGRLNSYNNIYMNNNAKGGINVKGLVNAKQNIEITDKNGNVVIGDNTNNDNYLTAGKDITIDVTDGSILNYGVNKILLDAGGDLTMRVVNGTIGLPVQQTACEGSGCTGIGPKTDGSRDFTKSINGKIAGKVNASTTNTKDTAKPQDLVINYAAIDSDMNIDTIKADGRVILTVDDSSHAFNGVADGKRYNMVNARPNDNTDTNVEGWGISLISNGSIGTKENALTFIQNAADKGYSMDALANENIYLKENSYNDSDYGRDKEITTNKVCTMIAREGDLEVEFAGNTTIQNITAEGDMTVITRGKTLEIENLGHIVDNSVIPQDYFGPRDYGRKDGGYDKPDYRDEALPNHAVIKALDINHNIRPTDELVDNGHEAWAGSSVTVHNAVLDNGTLDITADNVYANGIAAHFGKDGYSKEVDPRTNKVIGSDGIPIAHAVRPEDVESVGRNEHERNYYYHNGDGDGVFNGNPSYVDDEDDVVDATPLAIEDVRDPEPIPNSEPAPAYDIGNEDGRIAYTQRKGDTNIDNIDKRQFMRFNVSSNTNPVLMERTNNGVERLLDVSRGGIAVNHNNSLKVGDIVPVHLSYGGLDINANVKVVSATTSRAGAEFVNIDKALANQLLYLNILLEKNNKMIATRF